MSVCVDGYKAVITISFEQLRNGSWVPVANYTYEKCSVDASLIITALFFILFFIIAFILSALILVTIIMSTSLSKALVNHYIMNLCVTVMLDGVLNIIVSICYVAKKYWRFGYHVCYFNSFTVTLISIQMGFGILLLVIDRILVAKKFGSYMSLSKCSVWFITIFTWVISFIMALPLVWGLIKSVPYRNRYLCSVADKYDHFYLLPQIAIVIIGVTIILIVCVVFTIWIFHREQKRHRKVKGNQTFTYFDQILMTPYYKNEVFPTACAIILVIGYLLCWFPFACVVTITPLYTNDWNNETTPFGSVKRKAEFHFDYSNLLPRSSPDGSAAPPSQDFNMTSSSNNTDEPIPEMIDTPTRETAFIWMRYLYDVFIPILILMFIKEIRYKCKALIFVCRPNTVDSSTKIISPPYLNATFKQNSSKDKKQKNDNMVNFRTPVLFATSEGLYIRTVEDSFQEVADSRPLLGFNKNTPVEPQFNYDLCDVTVGGEDFTDFEGSLRPDDRQEYDRRSPIHIDPIVEGVQRAAVVKNVPPPLTPDRRHTISPMEKRPPTPPKPRSADERSDDIEMVDLEPHRRRNGKVVRFNTDLNQEIFDTPKSTDSDSTLESSIGSRVSSDSGNVADIEEDRRPPPNKVRKQPVTKGRKRSTVPMKKVKSRPPAVPTVRPPQKAPVKRLGNAPGPKPKPIKKQSVAQSKSNHKPSHKQSHKQSHKPNYKSSNKTTHKPKVKQIKSRYMNFAAANMDDIV